MLHSLSILLRFTTTYFIILPKKSVILAISWVPSNLNLLYDFGCGSILEQPLILEEGEEGREEKKSHRISHIALIQYSVISYTIIINEIMIDHDNFNKY